MNKQQDLDYALGDAIREGKIGKVTGAIKNGAGINSVFCSSLGSCYERTPLYWAVYEEEHEIAQMLCDYGADATIGEDLPLVCAAKNGDIRMINILLNSDIKIDVTADNNEALYEALDNGYMDVAQLLVKHGADMCDQSSSMLDAAICWSSETESDELVLYAIEAGARADVQKSVALRSAVKNNMTNSMILLLIIFGGDPLGNDSEALFTAASAGRESITRAMLEHVKDRISGKHKDLVLKTLGDTKRRNDRQQTIKEQNTTMEGFKSETLH